VQQICKRTIALPLSEGIVSRTPKRVHQRSSDLFGFIKGSISKYLVQVRAVSVTHFFLKPSPSCIIHFCEMSFVLCINHLDRATAPYHHIGREVPKRAVCWVCPVEGKHRLPKSTDPDLPTSSGCLAPIDAFNIAFPKPLKGKRPGKPIALISSAKTTFVDNPGDGFETTAQSLTKDASTRHTPVQFLAPGHERSNVSH
jgi:hypothetical protein